MFFGKKSANVGRRHIRLVHFHIFRCTRFFRLVVAFYELFCFVNRNFALNIFSGGFNQIVGWFKSIDGLQADCSLPRIAFLPFCGSSWRMYSSKSIIYRILITDRLPQTFLQVNDILPFRIDLFFHLFPSE